MGRIGVAWEMVSPKSEVRSETCSGWPRGSMKESLPSKLKASSWSKRHDSFATRCRAPPAFVPPRRGSPFLGQSRLGAGRLGATWPNDEGRVFLGARAERGVRKKKKRKKSSSSSSEVTGWGRAGWAGWGERRTRSPSGDTCR